MARFLTRDFFSGLLFLIFGVGAVLISRNYRMGTAMQMGPGFFPTLVGVLVALIGAGILIKAFLRPDSSEPVSGIDIRPLFLVLLAIVAFSLVIDARGLIVAVLAVVLIGHFAGRDSKFGEMVIMAVALCTIAVAIFVYGLKMPFQLRPW